MKISNVVAACFRPKMFRNMMQSFVNTTQGYDVETVVVVDKDVETLEIAKEFGCITDFSEEMRGGAQCWNIALKLCSGDMITPNGDDHKFYPGWLKYALESHHKRLNDYGMVGMNDLAYNGDNQVATMWIFDRKYCKEVMGGIFAPPCYNYYRIDSEWNAKAKMLGHFYWDERAIVEHLHSAHGKRPFDKHDTDRAENNYMELDRITFEDRQRRKFPIEWEPII